MSKLTEKLTELFTKVLESMGLAIVQVTVSGASRVKLQVMIERIDNNYVSMDDCVNASHLISDLLDVEDPFDKSYDLEVTSPGLNRPLVKPSDFKRFEGEDIKVSLFAPLEDGRKKLKGVLADSDDNGFTIEMESENISINIAYGEASKVTLDPDIKFNDKG
jgi:ribosome maturation factor RimP